MKIYVDGEEWEATPVVLKSTDDKDNEIIHLDTSEGLYRLQPVNKHEWGVTLQYAPKTPIGQRAVVEIDMGGVSEDQTQLIKESVEDLMVFIMGGLTFMDLNAANKARQSLSKYDG